MCIDDLLFRSTCKIFNIERAVEEQTIIAFELTSIGETSHLFKARPKYFEITPSLVKNISNSSYNCLMF